MSANGITETSVLVIGCGSVGPALATELGWRGVACVVVEEGDGTIDHPRASAENSRTMEFFRRWGIAETVRQAGTPEDYPQTALYLTSLTGFEIARIERPEHGGRGPTRFSPERPQRCNQIWLNPVLAERAASFDAVRLRYRCRFESFEQDENRVVATILDLATGERERIAADYLVDCSGGHSTIRAKIGATMLGNPNMDYSVNVFLRIPALWSYHDKGKASLHTFIGPDGTWANLTQLDGRELWRLGTRGKTYFDHPDQLDVEALVTRMVGKAIPYEALSIRRWIARDLVADKYRGGRVFLAGDAAHENTPSGGFGLNTGIGDVGDIGWKIEATLAGWGGPGLLQSYGAERQPIGVRNVGQATENYKMSRGLRPSPDIAEDSAEGAKARREMGEAIVRNMTRIVLTDGTALGYCYEGSPICCDDGTSRPSDTITEYRPTTRPGARAPHAWLADGRSIIDLFGRGFVLLRLGAQPAETTSIVAAFKRRGVPLTEIAIAEPEIAALYERPLVLVRPDGHVAWRSDAPAPDPLAIADRVRGAA